MTQNLKIDFVSDIACPWCAVGLGGLEAALEGMRDEVTADITFHPFELNPAMPAGGQNGLEHIAEKYGMAPAQIREGRDAIRERAAAVGFAMNTSDDSRIYNTFDAHRLLAWAKEENRQIELKRRLLELNFTDQADPSDLEALVAAAADVGLDAMTAREVLSSDGYADQVRAEEALWQGRGINSVPAVLVNDRYLISGTSLVSASLVIMAVTKKASRSETKAPARSRPGAERPPPFQPVQLATLVDSVPTGDRWLHEMKYDGYRLLVAVGGGEARAYTRSGLDWSEKFSEVVAEAAQLNVRSALLDGEAVVMDENGRSSFQSLQGALKGAPGSIDFIAFDLLELDGEDLTGLPLTERKERLRGILPAGDRIRYSEHIAGNGEKLLHGFCEAGLEGVISKKADGRYIGSRSGGWLKTKCIKRQEFVVVGWTPSDKSRLFRSLILGIHEDGVLRYAGKVGTGFGNDEILRLMETMEPLEQATPTVKAPRAEVRGAHWLRPKLVAEIAYTEMTNEGTLRHPSYLGLRADKKAEAVVLEVEQSAAEIAAPAVSKVKVSNPDRVIFPESSITKGQLADYYAAVAPIMLPWVGSRPMSLVRCPQGRGKKCFFQKHDAGSFGETVKHVGIMEKDGHEEPYLFIDTADGLLTCVQMGTIEFHGWGARIEDVEKADRLVFDLDPDEGLDFEAVRKAAFHFRDILKSIGLETFPMVTGGKGVHVIAPLVPKAEWPEVKDFAHRLALAVAQSDPENFTAALPKAQRKGRIFVDYLRNQRGATAVMPYGVRARENAPVAVPITWKEMETIDAPNHFHIGDAKELLKRAGSKALSGWGRADQVLPDL